MMGEIVTTIGLCMIVKNEARVLQRCLDSVRPFLDYVLIEDTGSTDGTQDLIRGWLDRVGLPGVVIEEPWRDFSYNRSHALAKLRERSEIDYAFMIDADDRIDIDAGFDVAAFKAGMTADFYDVEIHHGSIRHHRPQIYRNSISFTYRGVLHEFLQLPQDGLTRVTPTGFHMTIVGGGGRSRDKEKYQRDAALLEGALATEQDPFLISRYTFYLAQSYRDHGALAKALEKYLAREGMGFWDDEIYVALCEAAHISAELGRPEKEVVALFERAIAKAPHRAEALHGASHYLFENGRNEEGYQIAKRGLALTESTPPMGLFIQDWIYETGLLDEYAINAYWSGHYKDCLDANLRILSHPNCPDWQRKRFLDNAKSAAGNLSDSTSSRYQTRRLADTHAPIEARELHGVVAGPPRILMAILAKQKEAVLPFYLECIEALDYPKDAIYLYIRTNNNTDRTAEILRDWVRRVRDAYAGVEMDETDVDAPVEQFGVHEWNATRFGVLGHIRNVSLAATKRLGCDYYFVADVDNFIRPNTLRELVALGLPIAAPLLRHVDPNSSYSNYHAAIDANGYFVDHEMYFPLLYREVKGVCELPVVHCTYLVRAELIPQLSYVDDSDRHEYVVFSDCARRRQIPQYLDTRQVYGYLTMDEDATGARALIGPEIARALATPSADRPWLPSTAKESYRRFSAPLAEV